MRIYRKISSRGLSVAGLVFMYLFFLLTPLTVHAAVQSVTAALPVEQVFTRNSAAADISSTCTYVLTPLAVENPMPAKSADGSYTFTLDGTSKGTIGPITFTAAGIYSYEIKTSSLSGKGYYFDEQVYTATFYVNEASNALKAELIVQKSNGKKADSIQFKNSYSPLPGASNCMVKLTVTGNPPSKAAFSFLLTAGDKNNPMPAGSIDGVKTITIAGPGEIDFGTWEYTSEGTYHYTVSQVNTGADGYTYDMTIYSITDVVKEVDGQLVVSRTIRNRRGSQVQLCTYTNRYQKDSNNAGGNNAGGTNSGSGSTVKGLKTGDQSRWEFYVVLFGVSILAGVSCLFLSVTAYRKNKK